jgi:flagellar hook assembly protein FlgD
MPFNSMVTIKIYDISGKEIVTLINESKTAGYHTVEFNSNGIASGVYFYSITANSENGSFNKTLKMVMVK